LSPDFSLFNIAHNFSLRFDSTRPGFFNHSSLTANRHFTICSLPYNWHVITVEWLNEGNCGHIP
jgi:hypothetical protein